MERFDISRPPLREALKMLEHLGLVVQVPRRGAMVAPLTHHDVYEIMSLRDDLEQMADAARAAGARHRSHGPCHGHPRRDVHDCPSWVTMRAFGAGRLRFHIAVVSLAGHSRLEKAYRSMAMQLELCMALNNKARKGNRRP